MKILVDENIPLADELFGRHGELVRSAGREIDNSMVQSVDALIIRSVTKVSQELLQGSRVKFVGSATIGKDHVDEAWLQQRGIGFANAPGCNAQSVAEYVVAALLEAENADFSEQELADKSVAVIGYGNVGSAVATKLNLLVKSVVACDPPLAEQQSIDGVSAREHTFVSLETALQQDIICLHTPLTKDGAHPTLGMIDGKKISALSPGTLLLNAGRGGVIDESKLLERLHSQNDLVVVLDVWDAEPNINQALLKKVFIGTPHIAGYSLQGKHQGSRMIYQAFCDCFGLENASEEIAGNNDFIGTGGSQGLLDYVRCSYDIWQDHNELQKSFEQENAGKFFDTLRKNYRERNEFKCFSTGQSQNLETSLREKLKVLGFDVS